MTHLTNPFHPWHTLCARAEAAGYALSRGSRPGEVWYDLCPLGDRRPERVVRLDSVEAVERAIEEPMKPILRYPGAKWSAVEWVISHLVKTPHYVEPYAGSAAVYFNLPWRPAHAVLNDLSGDMVNLFRVLREQPEALIDAVAMTPYARAEYDAVQGKGGALVRTGEPLEDARRWVVRCWMAQGGRVGNRSGWAHGGTSNNDMPARWRRLPEALWAVVEPLRHAEIECRPAVEVMRRMASPDTLLYLDPPYVLSTRTDAHHGRKAYQHEMADADHAELLEAANAHPGPVALSGYRCTLYDDRLGNWRRVETQAQAEKGNTRTECLWLNPVLQERLSLGPLFASLEAA